MPELPEVETIAGGLRHLVNGRVITDVSIPGAHLVRGNQNRLEELIGRRILDVGRRGKLLIMDLNGQGRLVFHLRMTGRLGLWPSALENVRHIHLLLALDNASTLFFQDQRKFGTCAYFAEGEIEAWPYYAGLGPEPLQISAADFAARLRGKKGRIKAVLLDQKFIVGIGNIYADESLFLARIHPATPAHRLTSHQMRRLHGAIQDVLTRAIAAGGSSIRDYRTAEGLVGSFQDGFQAYGRTGLPCPRCGRAIQTAKIAGRTSCFCPRCQQNRNA
ncbi:MAG TPA: bifunctional DNA-formamidopyrimidine glycosylase/DNA-(apurinic or apyrimidinic site) lyase [Desulfonatronum sp.]|nr:bifunctional DNA-formamidopyrimidine glycosylase/DNA-(apurinic or apyrimidinic site) lyase [Desulfonatronum sp.]